MWSDNDIDNAFQRLNPPDPEPTPFPLDAWLRLENQLDKAVIERAVRRRLWQFFAAEVGVVLLIGLGWLLFQPAATAPTAATTLAGRPAALSATSAPTAGNLTKKAAGRAASATTITSPTNSLPASPNTAHPPVSEESTATETSATSSPAQSALTTSPSISTTTTTAEAPTISRPSKAHTFPVASAPTATEHSRTKRASAETFMRQQGSVGGFVAANETRKAARRPRERSSIDGRYAATSSADEAATEATVEDGTHPESNAARSNSSAAYAMTAGVRKRATTRIPNARSTKATEAAGAAAESAAAQTGAEAVDVADGFAPLALRLVPAPAAELTPLPTPLATVALTEISPKPEVPKSAHESRFYVALVGAPDVSTVRFFSIEKPMANVGVVLEYRLTSRLRVSTGLLRSTKQYVARRADYDFGAYAANITHRYFDDVDGSCTVLDVPLNLRYDLLTRPQYRLYGSAGLSSFFMQREQYSYAYTENYRPGYWQGEYVNVNRHYLSVLNLSAGYERALSARWSLQAEPYLKLPLAGIGNGKLRLTSAGVFLGVKYSF